MESVEGILYISTGTKYNLEAIRSAKSAKKHMPLIPIALFTDEQPNSRNALLFDTINIIEKPNFSFFDKIKYISETPFQKTIFVDTDTFFIDSVEELFLLLNKFDLAYCHAPWRICPGENNKMQNIPDCFPEANTGVLAYNKKESFFMLIDKWKKTYIEQTESPTPPTHDQPAFRKALYLSQIYSYVLPPEYNLRTSMPMFKGGGLNAKILHGESPLLEQAIQEISASDRYFGLYDFSNKLTMLNRLKRLAKHIVRPK